MLNRGALCLIPFESRYQDYSILIKKIVQCSSNKGKWSRSVVSDSLWPPGLQPPRLLRPLDFPGKRTGIGCHFLLQAILPTQGLNPGLLQCRQILYRLSHQGSPLNTGKGETIFTFLHALPPSLLPQHFPPNTLTYTHKQEHLCVPENSDISSCPSFFFPFCLCMRTESEGWFPFLFS